MAIPFKFEMALWLEMAVIPDHLSWFDVNGTIIFPVYGTSGGLSMAHVAYLIAICPNDAYDLGAKEELHDENFGKWYTLRWNGEPTHEEFNAQLKRAVEALG